jgi:hypothetical protein
MPVYCKHKKLVLKRIGLDKCYCTMMTFHKMHLWSSVTFDLTFDCIFFWFIFIDLSIWIFLNYDLCRIDNLSMYTREVVMVTALIFTYTSNHLKKKDSSPLQHRHQEKLLGYCFDWNVQKSSGMICFLSYLTDFS